MSNLQPKPFTFVLEKELEEIKTSRKQRGLEADGRLETGSGPSSSDPGSTTIPTATVTSGGGDQIYPEAGKTNLFGLAFSGGGIRSATLNLGILQGLAEYGLLKRVDYLSTVSGGGYIGGWLTSWIKRSGLDAVVKGLRGKTWTAATPEPKEISFLRSYSNYLTPRKGALSADTWTMIAIYIRNLILILTVLLLALAAVMLIPRLFLLLSEVTNSPSAGGQRWAFVVPLLYAGVLIAFHHYVLSKKVRRYEGWARLLSQQWAVQVGIVLPLFLAAWFALPRIRDGALAGYEYRAAVIGMVFALIIAFANWKQGLRGTEFWKRSIARLAALPTAGLLIVWVLDRLRTPLESVSGGLRDLGLHIARGMYLEGPAAFVDLNNAADLVAGLIFGVPAVIVTLSLAAVLYVGLMGRNFGTEEREWWARLLAWTGIYAVIYIGLFTITLIGPALLIAADLPQPDLAQPGVEKTFAESTWFTLVSSWILTTLGGLLAGGSSSTGDKKRNKVMEIMAGVAVYVFIGGFLIAIPWFTVTVAPLGWLASATNEFLLIFVLLVTACVLSWRFDINEFSIHNFYRNRLVRFYIGATEPDRHPHPFTGFDPREHSLRTSDLLVQPKPDPTNAQRSADVEKSNTKPGYDGPYHLLNTTLNLVSGEKLAWQQRMVRSFVFAPIYSGHEGAFRPTSDYDGGISLGTAMAISGAAASPNMGYHSSMAWTFWLMVFNLRLGRWIGNPKKNSWAKAGPTVGLKYLFSELFGLSNEQQSFVYLSDGGHFENLGIYELVRRRCRYIIACDGGSDANFSFEDLGNAIVKCRTDFGIKIDINVDEIRPKAGSTQQSRLREDDKKESEWHCAVGTIEYEDAPSGTLLYLKSSLTGNEPTDVERYKALAPDFPHHSTGDQFFDESQFESYRNLGQHIADETLGQGGSPDQVRKMATEDLFDKLAPLPKV